MASEDDCTRMIAQAIRENPTMQIMERQFLLLMMRPYQLRYLLQQAASGKYALNGAKEAVDGLTDLTAGVVGTTKTLGTWVGDKPKSAWDNLSNLKAKERREQERNKAKEEKHGTSDWEDPESENYVEWQKKQAVKRGGKDAGRRGLDAKPKGAPDRTKREIDDDYDQ